MTFIKSTWMAAGLLLSFTVYGQAILPTAWDFATTPASLPTGWSTNTTASYSSGLPDNSGGTSRAGKLQQTGHYFIIHFFDEPGDVTYNLKSYGTPSFAGTLLVQESVNGTSWSTLHSFGNNSFDDSWSEFTDTPDADSRYIRFILDNKVSGTNAGLDDVEVAAAAAGPEEEIEVYFDGNPVPNNTSIQFSEDVSNTKTLNLVVENLGTQDPLVISTIGLSGSASADYSLNSAPSSINALSSDTIKLDFTPSVSGNRAAIVSISNSDANENPFVIALNGTGGSAATEPTANPSFLGIQNLKTYRMSGSWSDVGADGYLVLMRKHAAISGEPIDGTEYSKGEGLGDAKVAYVGPNSSVRFSDIVAGTDYHFKIFAYNGSGSLVNYRTSDPLTEMVTTPERTMENNNYYNGIDPSATSFVQDLHDLINPHSVRFYSNYGPDMVPRFLQRDTTDGKAVITGVYSGDQVVYAPPFGWPETNMNREHTLPYSWMPSNGNTGTPEYQDFHHLMPTKAQANSQRSNHPLGEVVNVTNSTGLGKVGTDASGNTVYEPREGQKGDAARAIFYMQTAYHDPQGGDSWGLNDLLTKGPDQDLETLIEWHLNDLPSAFEKARLDYVDSLQKNRNPFIDSAHWVCYINFRNMSYISEPDSGCLARAGQAPKDTVDGVSEINSASAFEVFPNPSDGTFYITSSTQMGTFDVEVLSTSGQLVYQAISTSASQKQLNLNHLSAGTYLLKVSSGQLEEVHRIVIRK